MIPFLVFLVVWVFGCLIVDGLFGVSPWAVLAGAIVALTSDFAATLTKKLLAPQQPTGEEG